MMTNMQPWQPHSPTNPWGYAQPYQPPFNQPLFGPPTFPMPLYQQIYAPPAQVVVVQQPRRHSGLEGIAFWSLLFLGSRALVKWSRQNREEEASRARATANHYDDEVIPPRRSSAPQPSYAAPRSSRPRPSIGDGMYLVGVDVDAGTYRCEGLPGQNVYWERKRDASGESGSIISNFLGFGPVYVTINEGEFFRSERSGGWTRVFLG